MIVADLEKVDQIRRRTGVSYRKAAEALDAHDGDIVAALCALEEEQEAEAEGRWQERIHVRGGKLVEKVKQLVHEGNVNRIVIRQKGRTVLAIPVTIGAAGAVLAPYLALLGGIAALATHSTIVVERRGEPDGDDGLDGEEPDAATVM